MYSYFLRCQDPIDQIFLAAFLGDRRAIFPHLSPDLRYTALPMSTPTPDFLTFITNLSEDEIGDISLWLVKNERDYLVALGEMTKFRPIFLKTKSTPAQHRKWFRKYAGERPEFGPIWLMAYGVGQLGSIEEAALAKLPIRLREQLGYEPKDPANPPTEQQVVTFLKESEEAFGLTKSRQWGNIFLLIMDPEHKQPVHDALNSLGWNLSTPAATAEAGTPVEASAG